MNERARILLVDDDPSLLRVLAIRLERAGYEVMPTNSGGQALSALPGFRPELVITDMRMDGMDGMMLFDAVRARAPTLPVIALTAHGTIPVAVEATKRGIFAYLTKPIDKETLINTIEHALRIFRGADADAPASSSDWREEIISRSPVMETTLREAWRVSQTDVGVLICGEMGTGKELLAKAIHRASARNKAPVVSVNCTTIPDQLFEAELFGYREGAFATEIESSRGLAKAAQGGTLFLDEIGKIPLRTQANLLQMLQKNEIRPVGATSPVPIDVRVISATRLDIEAAIVENSFREDLYCQLNTVILEIPTLAQRREDIPLLAEHFLTLTKSELKDSVAEVSGFSDTAMELLMAAAWPGNVRQLRDVIRRCVVLGSTPLISDTLIERSLRQNEKAFLPFARARDQFEFDYLTRLLEMTEGNVAKAARLAERNRSEFYKLLKKHSLEPAMFRQGNTD
ncbi:MAG: sigma 54-interacting transcriptional regulator [Gammaproteobacteria bacterium]